MIKMLNISNNRIKIKTLIMNQRLNRVYYNKH